MPEINGSAVARQCLLEAKGDREKATRLMRKRADEDPALWKLLTVESIDGIIWEIVRRVGRDIHQESWQRGEGETSPKFSIYYYPLPNGTPLGRATRDDIQNAIDQRMDNLVAAQRDVRWYGAILRRLKDKQTVEQVLSEDELKRMQERALNGAKAKAA